MLGDKPMKDLIFLVDFDRTITMNDSTDELMNQYNPQMVEEYQKSFRRGDLRVREYIKGLLESLKITKDEYKEAVTKNLIIDPDFKKFIELGYEMRIVSAGTYENILPNFEKEGIDIPVEHIYSNKLTFNEDRPSVLSLKKTENTNLFSVGLLEKQVLAKHITTVPATLVMMRGKINFNINNESIVLRMGDVFEIPVNVEHEVVGRDIENIFLIVKELDANP